MLEYFCYNTTCNKKKFQCEFVFNETRWLCETVEQEVSFKNSFVSVQKNTETLSLQKWTLYFQQEFYLNGQMYHVFFEESQFSD